MKNVGGIFVTILIGAGVALVLGLIRWIQNIQKISKKFEVILFNFQQSKKIISFYF
jgi:uncharacterized membrane protein YidH (DUF202 family)